MSAAKVLDEGMSGGDDLSCSIEADHGQLKHRLRPMCGLQTDRTAQVVIAGHAFVHNVRRGHYDMELDTPRARRLAAAFAELARAI